jgi:hypothetical protein
MDDPSRIDTRNCSLLSRNIHHCPPPKPFATTTTQGTGNISADTRIPYYICHIPYILRTLTVIVPHAQSCVNGPTALNTGTLASLLVRIQAAPVPPHRVLPSSLRGHLQPSPSCRSLSALPPFPIYLLYLLSSPPEGFVHSTLAIDSLNCQPLSQTSLWRTSPATSATF